AYTNATACETRVTNEPTRIMNVHSSLMTAAFPSSLQIYNPGVEPLTTTLTIYDASGVRLSSVTVGPIPAKGQITRTVAELEAAARITPRPPQYHYVVRTSASFTGVIRHMVMNGLTGTATDMSPFCVLTGTPAM